MNTTKRSQAPALAVWLLDHLPFGADPALAGDLLEEFRQGRSPAWYWRQVAGAMLTHSLPAMRAIGISWLVNTRR